MNSYTTKLDNAFIGAIILSVAWGTSTVFHEVCHVFVAYLLGYESYIGAFTLSTGEMFVVGDMSALDTALVAVAGSVGIIVVGVLLVRSGSAYVKMAGIVFLCRAWIDVLPIVGFDGWLIAGSAGYAVAYMVAVAELLVCGGVILCEVKKI